MAAPPGSGHAAQAQRHSPPSNPKAGRRITNWQVYVIADGAYDGEAVYQEAATRQHDPPADVVIPPRSSPVATAEAESQTIRDRHVQHIAENRGIAWQKETGYGRRSLVETAIGRYKPIIDSTLRARSTDGQGGEAAITVQVLNRMIRVAKPISVRRI